MAWTDTMTALSTFVGAAATGIGAYYVYVQIGAANTALWANNSYSVHKDIVEGYDRLLAAQDDAKFGDPKDLKLRAALTRAALKYDGLIETAEALKNNKGLSVETWTVVLQGLCPSLAKAGNDSLWSSLDAAKRACARDTALWQGTPK